jgi:polyhydroxyalkanoate synthase
MNKVSAGTKHVSPRLRKVEAANRPLPSRRVKPGPGAKRPYQTLDRGLRAAFARASAGMSTHAFIQAYWDWAHHLAQAPGRQMELAEHAQKNLLKLLAYGAGVSSASEPPFKPRRTDHRFEHAGWNNAPFNYWKQSFLAAQDWWDVATEYLPGLQQEDADRTRFLARQSLDLVSPSNFPWLNPEIIEATLKRGGANLVAGAAHFAHDFHNTLTQAHEDPPEGYRIGTDLASTPGEVVFQNELFELIQYAPQGDVVQAEPVLIVPAWIMKYYILDLSPHNSMVRYLVDQGFTVFMISWCNPHAEQSELSLEDYRKSGVMTALDQVQEIVPEQQVHAVGYCLGGTMLAIAAATMARDKDTRLASLTLMAAQVDFAEAGELLLFLDESQVAFLEDLMWDQGYLDRPQMARAFSTIRAEDLIYSRNIRRYFLGVEDLPTDMNVWLSDTTRMPARMHSQYLRGLFLENRLSAGRFAVEGRVIALKDISAPVFVVATETDHIAPWKSVYKTKLFTNCDLTFVLTSGGHNSGIINEPAAARGHYRISYRPAGALYIGPDDWLEQQRERPGSWWIEWRDWLKASSSRPVPARLPDATTRKSPKGVPAPGTYVHQS